jgi:3-phenylpropionate/trans-cinnamate dioxygenase ferredoxin reductase component
MSVAKNNIVIVGTGQGGFQAAASLRQEGFEGKITILGADAGLPYQRPPLSKTYFKDSNASRLLFRNQDFFDKHHIDIVEKNRAIRIDRDRKIVAIEDGRQFDYDHLILATGTKNRELPIAGTDLGNVLQLRTLADADKVRSAAEVAKKAVMIGGGFIGLEVASVLAGLGIGVSIIELAPRVMARVVSEPVSEHFANLHAKAGTKIHCGLSVNSLLGDDHGKVQTVVLSDGTELAADLVVVCAGVVPDIDIAIEAGLETDNGIVVDEMLVTSDNNISAIGDCAAFVHGASRRRVRLESVQNAVDQAKCVAKNIMGKREAYDRVAWFWSDQANCKLQIAGLTDQADRWHVSPGETEEKLSVFTFKGEDFIGAETINNATDHMMARKILALDEAVTFGELKAHGFDLRALLKAKNTTKS